ncbi:UNVERIFIED_CONTAM: uncharacterized protein YjbJ (UPF0337 family) [Streptomyces graminofaciens]
MFEAVPIGEQTGSHDVEYSWDVNSVAEKKKTRAKLEQAKGKAKETAGRAVGNERLTAEGRAEQAKGDARQAKEKTKDVFKH